MARAELGMDMTFDEVMELIERTALEFMPDVSIETGWKLMLRLCYAVTGD